jgi:hypothetical protein
VTPREAIHKIPPVARPLLFIVVPLVLFHQLRPARIRTPQAPSSPSSTSGPAASAPARRTRTIPAAPATRLPQDSQGDFPKGDEVRAILEQNASFLAPKRATCPTSGPPSLLERYPLFRAFRAAGYLDLDTMGDWERESEARVELTDAARSQLGDDLREGPAEISVIVAKKNFIEVAAVEPPPQPLAPPVRDTVRVDFMWTWAATNPLAGYLDFLTASNGLAGSAYVRHLPDDRWQILEIKFRDMSADLTMRR